MLQLDGIRINGPNRRETRARWQLIVRIIRNDQYARLRELLCKELAMIEQFNVAAPSVLAVRMSGKLHDEDYKKFVPLVDNEIAKSGKVSILAHFHDFHGWDPQALWDDIKFSTTHCNKIERIALVGDEKWEKWMATVCKPFTMAKIRYFDSTELVAAENWLAEP